ncbi:hypothetical protein MTO96_014563 [Rhipicephalus appendiculatus]
MEESGPGGACVCAFSSASSPLRHLATAVSVRHHRLRGCGSANQPPDVRRILGEEFDNSRELGRSLTPGTLLLSTSSTAVRTYTFVIRPRCGNKEETNSAKHGLPSTDEGAPEQRYIPLSAIPSSEISPALWLVHV